MIVVFDLDGTLANCEHRLHHIKTKPKNWKAFFDEMHNDTVIEPIAKILDYHLEALDLVIFCTGRPETHRGKTQKWINDNLFDFLTEGRLLIVYMRAKNDNRPDYITKVDLLHNITYDQGKPDLWYDDRGPVVKALRENHVRVLQVADNE